MNSLAPHTSHASSPDAPAVSRRGFLLLLAGTALNSLPGAPGARGTYSVALLGDTHFDSTDPGFYHRGPRAKHHLAEHQRNAAMWRERMPRLLKASSAAVRPDTAFVLQLGDLVQGDCYSPDCHRRQLTDMTALLGKIYGPRLPFVTVVGNHDIRGRGARKVYDETMPPRIGRAVGQPVGSTTFAFRQGPDVFIAVDFNAPRPNLDRIKHLLAQTADARHTFVVSHGPVIPSGASRWFLYGKRADAAKRRELRDLLAARHAIVLAGHTHKLEYYDFRPPQGRITQLVANSVWTAPGHTRIDVIDKGASAYGKRLVTKQTTDLVAEYRPFVTKYLYAAAAGHYRLNVSDTRVSVDVFCADARRPSRTVVLRG